MNRIHQNLSIFILMLLCGTSGLTKSALESDLPLTGSGTLQFHLDRAAFHGNAGETLQEFYLMLFADQFAAFEKNSVHMISMEIQMNIIDMNQQSVKNRTWTTEASLTKDLTELNQAVIYDQWSELIAPGPYHLELIINDVNSDHNGSLCQNLTIPAMPDTTLTVSEIEFVTRAYAGGEPGPFYKNQRTVIPNPTRRFGILNPILYLYFELYQIPEFMEVLNIGYEMTALTGTFTKTLPAKSIKRPGTSASLLHGFDVSTIPSGIYELRLTINNQKSGKSISSARHFEIIQADYLTDHPLLSEQQATEHAHLLEHLATKSELELYEQLDLNGKAQFLIEFWRKKDPSPQTMENEYLTQIRQRYQYANDHFRWAQTEGWATDRGAILIRYGVPDEIERHYAESGTRPYEIWLYRQERTWQFIFGDLRTNGNFVLLHSNHENEVHNASWREWLMR